MVDAGGVVLSVPVNTVPLGPDDTVEATGNETIDGVKTFLKSPVVPAGTVAGHAVQKAQNDLKADDAVAVHKSGDETVAGNKTFPGQTVFGAAADNFKLDASGRSVLTGNARIRRRIGLDIFEGVETANNPGARVLLNNPDVQGVRFNDSADKQVLMMIRVPDEFDSTGTTKLFLYWTRQDAGSGNVLWKVAHVAVTPGSGELTGAVVTDSFAVSAVPAVNAVKEDSVVLTAAGWAAGDVVSIRIFRNATNALDTFDGGRPILLAAQVEYVANKIGVSVG